MEKVAWMTKLPVVISGIESKGGLISNSGYFDGLIRKYELRQSTSMKVYNAKGFFVYIVRMSSPRHWLLSILVDMKMLTIRQIFLLFMHIESWQ